MNRKPVIHLECGQHLLEQDLASARSHCESFVAPLEEYRRENGVYPPRLSLLPFFEKQQQAELDKKIDVPWILKDGPFYQADEERQTYCFQFDDPADIGELRYVYSSSSPEWRLENKNIG